jgi:two-component system sensor histidine kinase BaeS
LTKIATQLSSGNYQYRAKLKQKDELGQLAIDLNHLGKTLQQNQTSRQQWIADISHELRTPLSILRGELEAIEDGIRPMNKTSIQSLVAEVKRLGKLVEDLYQLSLSDLGALNYVKEPLDLYELIQNVATFFTQRFNEHNIDISFHIDNQAAMIFGDEKRFFQLFSNLFENTVRYTDAGGQLEIYCSCENNQIRVKLEDSKPAVSDEQLTRLFDRLYRVEASRNRASGGAGLGLSIVKAVADAHNATIISSHSSLGGLAVTLEIEQYLSK